MHMQTTMLSDKSKNKNEDRESKSKRKGERASMASVSKSVRKQGKSYTVRRRPRAGA